ncbi:DUF3732 domain-containing protein [Ralstonia syzygii]|uniref:Plasmid-related protein n=1 Tax=Ralstonia syzygii R24 TaxID=907261 RepID=G3A7S2_9RALS|nr:DUF3732 domain-containing protein [Ralstonia syzygii]CCA86558.1 conserved hypothetical protein [Ralstonia syzygii R24]
MQLQILKLIIWPKVQAFGPQIVHFEKGRVNVITGGSRTGKSAIIPIIDYCLASSECQIPIDTIRDHSAWYGLLLETEHEQWLLARKGPEGRDASDAFYLMRGEVLSIPPTIEAANEKLESIKHLLNALADIPYFRLSAVDDPRPFQERLSFRDLMTLVFQSQEVVANQNILFYKTHAHEHRERLKNWLPYILGAENQEVLIARQRLGVVQAKLSQLRREYQKQQGNSRSWLDGMINHLRLAKRFGLLAETYDIPEESAPEDLIRVATEILATRPERPAPTAQQLDQSAQEMIRLEEEEDKVSDEISRVRKRLDDIHKLKAGLTGYGNAARRRADRLQISQWLDDITKDAQSCPLCGEAQHERSRAEMLKIAAAFQVVETEANRTREIPSSFAREELNLKTQLESALERRTALGNRIDKVLRQDRAAKEQFDRRQNMFYFLGHLKASVDMFRRVATDGDLTEQVRTLENEERDLLKQVDPKGVERRLDAALRVVVQKTLTRLQTLDAEDKYKQIPPQFSVKDLNLRVQSNDGHWHFLAEVGSASNWLSFHIAFICALHEFFNEQPHSCVPSFAVFDQPSQVYFPKTSRVTQPTDLSRYDDEDVQAVIGIFQTLADSVREQGGKWQCIVLDHARDEIYDQIDEVYEVDVWRDGKKLIPPHWYQ